MKKSLLILTCLVLLGGVGNLSFATGELDSAIEGTWKGTVNEGIDGLHTRSVTWIIIARDGVVAGLLNEVWVDLPDFVSYWLPFKGTISTALRKVAFTVIGIDGTEFFTKVLLSEDGLTLEGSDNVENVYRLRKVQ